MDSGVRPPGADLFFYISLQLQAAPAGLMPLLGFLASASRSSRVSTKALESSIVIAEGVSLALIREGRKKSFLRASFHLYDSGYTHTATTA